MCGLPTADGGEEVLFYSCLNMQIKHVLMFSVERLTTWQKNVHLFISKYESTPTTTPPNLSSLKTTIRDILIALLIILLFPI